MVIKSSILSVFSIAVGQHAFCNIYCNFNYETCLSKYVNFIISLADSLNSRQYRSPFSTSLPAD